MWRGAPSVAGLTGLALALAGFRLTLVPLRDNSFLTHLATGRIIVDGGGIPRTDPFSFSAPGHDWTVQSWLAATLYGWLEDLAGGNAIQLVVALTAAALTAVAWALTRPARSLLPRIGLVGLLLAIGHDQWVERPFLFGLLFLGLTLLAAERRLHPAWLLAVFWLWVNVHGSFPLGLVAIALLALGVRLDDRGSGIHELRVLRWAVAGTLLGALNPLGPKLLVFPVRLLARRDALQHIVEWRAPQFEDLSERAFLVLVIVAAVALVRRPSWRAALPVVVLVPAALLSARNIPVAALALLPGAARGLADLGTLDGEQRRPAHRPVAAMLVGLGVALAAVQLDGDAYSLEPYPLRAVRWLEDEGLVPGDRRVVAQDAVGNLLEAAYGTRQRVFIDDRYDMFPRPVIDDYLTMLRGTRGWDDALARARPDVVLWQRDLPLGQLLELSDEWTVVYRDDDWLVACPLARPCT